MFDVPNSGSTKSKKTKKTTFQNPYGNLSVNPLDFNIEKNVAENLKGVDFTSLAKDSVKESLRNIGKTGDVNNVSTATKSPTPAPAQTVEKTEYEKRLEAAQGGDTWWTGPMNNTQMGKSLQSNINQQMAGKESNSLLNAQQSGAEALARKSGDIRGAAAQNAIMNGQLGQGMAQTGKMQAELATMQQLGDFQTNMAGLAAQEQQQAQQNALAALGLMQRDEEISETKRQALISDDLADDRFRLDLIDKAAQFGMSGTVGTGMDEFSKEVLTAEGYEKAKVENAQAAADEELMQGVRATLSNVTNENFDQFFEKDPATGLYKFGDQTLNPSQSLEVANSLANSPEASFEASLASGNFDSLTDTQFMKLSTDPQLREASGIMDGLSRIGHHNSFDSQEEGGRPAAVKQHVDKYGGKVYYDKGSGTYYRLTDGYHKNAGSYNFRVNMNGVALNGPNKGQSVQGVWTSKKYDLP